MKKTFYIIIFWFIIMVVSLLPLSLARIGLDAYMLPQIEIGIAFFLSIFTNILPLQLFLYGLFIDVAYGNHIGITAFILLVMNSILYRFKANLCKQDMSSILKYFIITLLIVETFKYLTFAFETSDYQVNFKIIAINLLINITFYPILHIILVRSTDVTYTK